MTLAGALFLTFVGLCTTVPAHTPCRDVYPHPGWNLVFKASKGNSQSVFDLWTSRRYTCNPTPLQTALNSLCGCHFKSQLVERWNSLNIKMVSVAFYDQASLAPRKVIYFNGRGSNKMNWFAKSTVLSSSPPWTDLKNSKIWNYFSIPGDAIFFRRFFINHSYGGCANDIGWSVIVDSQKQACQWEKKGYWPAFLYCKGGTRCNFNHSVLNVGVPEFVKCMAKCIGKSLSEVAKWFKVCKLSPKCWLKKVGFKALKCVPKCIKRDDENNGVGQADVYAIFIYV